MHKTVLSTLIGVALSLTMAGQAFALNARTWISGKGVDQAGCGPISSPCRTLQFAHDQTSAGGEIDVLDAAGYGSIVISKAISVINDGAGVAGALAPAQGTAILINAQDADDVILKGLTIEGSNVGYYGVLFNSGRKLVITDCFVSGFSLFTQTQSGIGINLKPASTNSLIVISSTKIFNNYYGVYMQPPTSTTRVTSVQVNDVVANGNAIGLRFDGTQSLTTVAIVNSTTSGNSTSGVILSENRGSMTAVLDGHTAVANGEGLTLYANFSTNKFYVGRSTFVGNSTGISLGTGNPISAYTFSNNQIAANGTDIIGSLAAAPLK